MLTCRLVQAEPFVSVRPTVMAFAPPTVGDLRPSLPFQVPVGAKYQRSMNFPVLGRQAFQLHILSETKAHLIINGLLAIDEVIPYTMDFAGRLTFSLPDKARQVLRKFRTKLLEAGYDARTDTPYFKVAPYILPVVKVQMGRVIEEETQ